MNVCNESVSVCNESVYKGSCTLYAYEGLAAASAAATSSMNEA